ncbi:MAG: hypothetical protein H0X66_14610 [Verrucomicrobia bacterium]|nr:hypothetical protein [Verrucomicrobiota bacterium]
MRHRIILFVVATFWVTMICLLWRSEYGDQEVGSSVPVENVWERVLTAPDDSSLDIFLNRKKIGYCRWTPNVGEDATTSGRVSSDEYQPEGIVKRVSDYTLELEGNVNLQSLTNNLRFELTMRFATNHNWETFRLHVSMRPHFWEVSANRSDEELRLVVNDESGLWEHDFPFADLQNPEKLVQEFGGPVALALFRGMGLRAPAGSESKMSLGINWEARNDWMRFGHSRVRVYRLEAKLLDKLKIFVFVSRVGEILWVHLPGEVVLSNNAFEHF